MITLKRLHVNNFKGLRAVEIIFPEQGSLLIEGHNEAGKSTLFEAVYVGLYGKPLVGEGERARNEEVIQYNQLKATVELVVNIGTQTLSITRIFERGKPQFATMSIEQPGMIPEVINRVRTVDDRILKELGNLDGESLRNSCFVEQKELGRIEALNRAEREQAIQKLLGLERLTQLMDEFKYRREQERELILAEKRLTLAQLQDKVRTVSIQERTLGEQLDAVKIASYIERLADLALQQEAIEKRLNELASIIQQAQERLDRCGALKERMDRGNQIAQSLIEVSYSRRDLNQIKDQLARLEQIEKVDLPLAQANLKEIMQAVEAVAQVNRSRSELQQAETKVAEAQRLLEKLQQIAREQQQQEANILQAQARLEKRNEEAELERLRLVTRLNELNAKRDRLEQALALVTQWEEAGKKLHEIQQTIAATEERQRQQRVLWQEWQQRELIAHNAQEEANRAEQEKQNAAEVLRLAIAYSELTAWIRLKGVESALHDHTRRQNELLVQKQAAEAALETEQSRMRTPLFASLALSFLTVVALGVGFIWLPAFFLLICLGGGAIAAWIWLGRTRNRVRQQSHEVQSWTAQLQQLDMQRQAAIQTGGDPAALQSHERQLLTTGIEIPSDLVAAQQFVANLQQTPDIANTYQARERERAASEKYIRLQAQLQQAQAVVEESKSDWTVSQQTGDPAKQLAELATRETGQGTAVAEAEQKAYQSCLTDGLWPTSSQAVQSALSVCQSELRSTADTQKQHEMNAFLLLQEAQADLEKAQEVLRQTQENVAQQKASDPAAQLSQAQSYALQAQAVCKQREERSQQCLQKVHLSSETEVDPERGRIEARIQAYKSELDTRPAQIEKRDGKAHDFVQKVTTAAMLIKNLLTEAQSLAVEALPLFQQTAKDDDSSFPYEDEWSVTLEHIARALQNAIISLDEPGARSLRDTTLGEQGSIKQQASLIEGDAKKCQSQIQSLLTKRSLQEPSVYTAESIAISWPLVAQVTPDEETAVSARLEETSRELYATRQQEGLLATELHVPGTQLNIEECQQTVDKLSEEREICLRAQKLLRETHDRIARRVLPITERNMQPLLQQLTSGRYRDVRLTPEDTNGQPGEMDYRIRVWNPTAGRYVAKNIFSGGTRDQCSLALRLAFALATLPQELGVAPGFIFLDEPLSAFDAQRAQALVDLLTTGTIARQFSQVVLISHNHAFNREAFRYHVRMESGQIVESDLPEVEDHGVLLEAALH